MNTRLALLAFLGVVLGFQTAHAQFYRYSTQASLLSTQLKTEANESGSALSSETRPTLGARAQMEYLFRPTLSFTVGLGLEYNTMQLSHRMGALVAEFESRSLQAGLPVGVKFLPFNNKNFYFPLALVPRLKLSEETSVVRCTGLCANEDALKSTSLSYEVGFGWQPGSWDFQIAATRSMTNQLRSDSADLRSSGVRFALGHVW